MAGKSADTSLEHYTARERSLRAREDHVQAAYQDVKAKEEAVIQEREALTQNLHTLNSVANGVFVVSDSRHLAHETR